MAPPTPPQAVPPPPEPRKAFETWVDEKKPPAWKAAAARAMRSWAIGREVTEAEFDAAIQAAGEIPLGYDLKR